MAAVGRGERQALARLYAATSAQLFGIALRIMKRRDRAEEVLQDAFVSVWQRARDYDAAKGSVMTWMASIVRNRAIDVLRRDRPSVSIDDAPGQESWASAAPDPFEATLASVEARRVRDCLETLDEKPRRAIMLAYYDGLTQEELASKLEAPLGTIKSWVRRGLLRLKDCLEP
ncbi:MAG TPA: sigma-70 family RNA polymerase sigma factor [Alphaproteobacteria bacterium]|nr:sigma-70 family RNA polymerase sigma factor [Alphaproteobacteria bacterium]